MPPFLQTTFRKDEGVWVTLTQTFTDERQRMIDDTIADCAAKMCAVRLQPGEYGEHVMPLVTKQYWGLCRYTQKSLEAGHFAIECASTLDGQQLVETLYHELVHTLPGCQNHHRPFIAACKIIDEAYGTDLELGRIDRASMRYFKESRRLVMRFTGGMGERYGVMSEDGELLKPLYEIVSVLPDGRREVLELSTGRTFRADLVTIRALRYRSAKLFRRYPDIVERLRASTTGSTTRLFSECSQKIVPAERSRAAKTEVVGDSHDGGLYFETVGRDRMGSCVVRDPLTGGTLSSDVFEVRECSYRRSYLAHEAMRRWGLGKLPDTIMKCPASGCEDAIYALAELVERVWNVSDLVRDGASTARIGRVLRGFDRSVEKAAEKCQFELLFATYYACFAFKYYAQHRGIAVGDGALLMLIDRILYRDMGDLPA